MLHWVYNRLNVHVSLSDAELDCALERYADSHIVGGRGALLPEHYCAIRREHAEARQLYADVMGARI